MLFFNKKRNVDYEKLKGLKLTKEQKKRINKIINEKTPKDSTQSILFFDEILKNGICKVGDTYSKTVKFFDINYMLANNEDKANIFNSYCEFLNYFNEKIKVQLTFFNQKTDGNELLEKIHMQSKDDDIEYLRKEYYQMLKNQLEKGNNGIIKLKYLTFSIEEDSYKKAKQTLERIELNVINNFKTMGVFAKSLNGYERLELLHNILNKNESFNFDFSLITNTGLTTKDFVAPMCSKNNKSNIKLDKEISSTFYLQINVDEMEDRILDDLLEIDRKLLVNIHLVPFEQSKAIELAKNKKVEVDSQKIKNQQKAFANRYDMDILPLELQENIEETTNVWENLKSRNEHLFLATIIITTFGKNKSELEDVNNDLEGVVQKHSLKLKALNYQQEQALNSSLPIGNNLIKIQRSLMTTSTAIFVPFTTEELLVESTESLYYGLNALSNNIILADRKELKNPNGLILGTPGSGKSFMAKREITNVMLSTNDDIIISDPEDEFSPLVKAFGGQVINISPTSKDYINIMDINLNYSDDDNPLSLKSDFLLAFFEQIFSIGLTPVEKSIIDRCIKLVYQPYMSNPIDVAKDKFKNSKFVVDKYHWIRQVIWAFENVRKQEQKKFYKEYRKYFKRSKSLLTKRFEFLKDDEKAQVNVMLYKSENIRLAHMLKEDFLKILECNNRNKAKKKLTEWIMYAQESGLKVFEKCATTMINWSTGILNSFDTKYTNGYIEGCNNKIKVLKRNAYGYRNFKRFRNRILHIFNYLKV